MAGGAAAIDPVTGRSHLIPGGGEAAVLLLEDERYQFEAVTENLHTTLLERCTLTFSDPRVIDTINGCDALAWYQKMRAALGFGETDFEHVTLTDPLGVNASVVRGRKARLRPGSLPADDAAAGKARDRPSPDAGIL